MGMVRTCIFVFLVGVLAADVAVAQCRGGGGQWGGTSTGTTGTTSAAVLSGLNTGGSSALLTGPGSLAYDLMMSQMVAQRMAQQQAMLAMQQQKVKAEKLAARKYRAENTRAQVAASRERTRALLAAKNGLSAPQSPTLVAFNAVQR